MLSVKHERPSQRLQHRVNVPIKVELIGEGVFESVDWSLNGIALKEYNGPREVGDKAELEISIPFQGFEISFTCESELVRRNGDILAFTFISIDDRGRDLLTHFIEEVIRGSVTSTDEILRRIDTPVTPVTTTEEASDSDTLPIKRISWKVVRMVVTHLIVGFVVFGYGGYFIYQNFFMLNVTTAVISAPVNPILSPINGYLREVVVRKGEVVNGSQILMRLSNPELDNQIDFAKINVDRRMMELRVRRAEYQSEVQKNDDFKRIAQTKLDAIENRLERLQAKEILEDLRHEIIEEDFVHGGAGELKVIDSSLRRIGIDEDLDEARQLLKSRRLLLDSIERGTLIHDNIESKLSQARVKMEFAEDQLILTKDELSALRRQQRWMDIVAPAEGQLAQLLRAPGTAIKKGEKLALFEINESRVIKAFLTPSDVLRVGLGDSASVYFPSLDRYVQAQVSNIDATSGTLSAKDIDYIWRRPNEPSARVTMEFIGITDEEIRANFPSGLPATVVFDQRATDGSSPLAMISKIQGWWQDLVGADSPEETAINPKLNQEMLPETPQELPRQKPTPYVPNEPRAQLVKTYSL